MAHSVLPPVIVGHFHAGVHLTEASFSVPFRCCINLKRLMFGEKSEGQFENGATEFLVEIGESFGDDSSLLSFTISSFTLFVSLVVSRVGGWSGFFEPKVDDFLLLA